ncbi:hypothetical protein MTO96_020665 [Rhipicephalus appendiculatus]
MVYFVRETRYSNKSIDKARHRHLTQRTKLDVPQTRVLIDGAHAEEVTAATKKPANVSADTSDFFLEGPLPVAFKDALEKYPIVPIADVKIVLIIAYYRSGSSFFGELMSSTPRTFFHYEPLMLFTVAGGIRPGRQHHAFQLLDALVRCRFKPLYTAWMESTLFYKHNHFLADICEGGESCFSPGHLTGLCSRAQAQVFKFTRLRVTQVQSWIQQNPEIAPSVRVIHLVRDPRAMYASRRRQDWCTDDKQCGSAVALCDQVRSDLDAFGELGRHLPSNRIYQMRFEDLAADPLNETRRLFTRLGLDFAPSVSEYSARYISYGKLAAQTKALTRHGIVNLLREQKWMCHKQEFSLMMRTQKKRPQHQRNLRMFRQIQVISFSKDLSQLRLRMRLRSIPIVPIADVKIVLIIAYYRSGSSFFGELMSSTPRTFFHYEPLMLFTVAGGIRPGRQHHAFQLLDALVRCRFEPLYTAWMESTPYYKHNHFLADICKGGESCFSPGHLTGLCSRAQTQVFKFTRLRVTQVQSWIQQNPEIAPSVRVIHLVRDPRAMYASRRRLDWCRNDKHCGSAAALCDQVRSDLDAFGELGRHLPSNRIYQMRFEDLAADPLNETRRVFTRLGLDFAPSVFDYVGNHTTATGAKTKDDFSTWRNTKEVADRWRRRLPLGTIRAIETRCSDVILRLGYRLA